MKRYMLKQGIENFYAGSRIIFSSNHLYGEKEIPEFAKKYFECKEENNDNESSDESEEDSNSDEQIADSENLRRNSKRRG